MPYPKFLAHLECVGLVYRYVYRATAERPPAISLITLSISMSEPQKDAFLSAAYEWICDDYFLDIRYIATPSADSPTLISAAIGLYPMQTKIDNSFCVHTPNIWVGQIQRYPLKKSEIEQILRAAIDGSIAISDMSLRLGGNPPFDYYSEMTNTNRWFSELHLQVSGGAISMPSPQSRLDMDNVLRAAEPPFDGIQDAVNWLHIDAAALNGGRPVITVRVWPPVDLVFERSNLLEDELSLEFHAHPSFNTERMNLAIRGEPSSDLSSRKQLAQSITWQGVADGKRVGTLQTSLPNADSALTMLLIGESTVRRQWFVDATKARNRRWMVTQHFDSDLQKLRNAVLTPVESRKFEQGIASLLFLLGFSPVVPIETDAPDLIVTTPRGQLVIVECTTKIADFSSKVGKLVDRRGSLSKALSSARHPSDILAVLICALERDQIAKSKEELQEQKVLLLTREDLVASFDRVRHQTDPDTIVTAAFERVNSNVQRGLFGA